MDAVPQIYPNWGYLSKPRGAAVTGFISATQADVQSIVHGIQALCTMLRRRKPSILNDFALPTGTIVHSIHGAYIAFLAANYYQVITSNYFFRFREIDLP